MSRNRAEMYSMAAFRSQSNKNNIISDSNNSSNKSLAAFTSINVINSETVTENNVVDDNSVKLVCYYSLPINGTTEEQLLPEYIDPLLCTHIIIAFAFISNGTLLPGSTADFEVSCTFLLYEQHYML